MERTKKWWAITSGGLAAAALTTAVVLAGPASATADPTATAPSSSSSADGSAGGSAHPQYCDHIQKALDRRQKVASRWTGDASTRGSVAWLQARAATVSSTNPQLATLLTDEAARRAQNQGPAATIIADLQAVQQARCGS